MATGFMVRDRAGRMVSHSTLAALCLLPAAIAAQEIGLAGVMGSRALLVINGGEPRPVAVGQTVDGVKVVSVRGDQAVIEIGGKARPLRVGQNATATPSVDGSGKVTMTADGQGHFFTTGSINGVSVRMMVDTGATMISLGPTDARRIGVNLGQGVKGMVNTANGQAVVTKVKLDTVRIGDISINNVDALIHATELPVALLGMSFLNRMEMQQDNSTMTLKKRF